MDHLPTNPTPTAPTTAEQIAPSWKLVQDDPPPFHEEVLLLDYRGSMCVGMLTGLSLSDCAWLTRGGLSSDDFTHWHPLPGMPDDFRYPGDEI